MSIIKNSLPESGKSAKNGKPKAVKRNALLAFASTATIALLLNTGGVAFAEETNTGSVASSAVAAATAPAATGTAVTVSTADELYNAITVSTANIINIAGNIDLHDKGSSNIRVTLGNAYRRDITIQSADGTAYSVDFSGYSFTLGSGYTVAFKNLDLYGQQWYGAIQGATTYNYENVTYTGSQLVNSDDGAVNFYGNVTSNSVATYSNPVSGKSYSTQGNGNQQVIEGKSATFKAGSNVTLTSVSGNVLQIASGGTGVTVEEGANVTLKPRKTTISTEASKNGTNYGIVLDSSSLSVAEGATLTVDLANESGDRSMSGGIYMTGNNAAIDVAENGKLLVNTNGTPSVNVVQMGGGTVNINENATFALTATNAGSYAGNLMAVSGATVNANPYSTFTITSDGTGALTALNVASGSVNVDQPTLFKLDLSGNTNASSSDKLVSSGKVNVTNSKQIFSDGTESEPINNLVITYNNTGTASSGTNDLESTTEAAETDIRSNIVGKTQDTLTFTRAGETVDIVDDQLSLSADNVLTGKVTVADGNNEDVWISVTITPTGGSAQQLTGEQGPYWRDTTTKYQTKTDADGNFTVDLSAYESLLSDKGSTVTVLATKNFIDDTASKTVAELRKEADSYVPAYADASVEAGKSTTVAPTFTDSKGASTTAPSGVSYALGDGAPSWATIDTGTGVITAAPGADVTNQAYSIPVTVTYSDSSTDSVTAKVTVTAAVDTTALQTQVDKDADVKASTGWANASDDEKTAYNNALAAANTVLSNPDATQDQVNEALKNLQDAANSIAAKGTDKTELQNRVDNSDTVKSSTGYENATDEQKTAYDNALAAADTVLKDPNAIQAEVDKAIEDLKTAEQAIAGATTDKVDLQAEVNKESDVTGSTGYQNASDEQKQAYQDVLKAAQDVLADDSATQAEVNDAL
ncbi:Rib/alpha-like domain-containing protein [Bifidobacterium tsurumiense]|uniref:Rib/alpha-like domain-containing protein n=1 Tax=Bifidobacterium tsurumiense TaxID=356829 RepID=UPI0012B3A514|nr:Rib/alpha-like domain-containing protein [Bifidobacterium tsurumiense]MSS12406.1 hypothetical protein [Bifidobacterium tsurumiense]